MGTVRRFKVYKHKVQRYKVLFDSYVPRVLVWVPTEVSEQDANRMAGLLGYIFNQSMQARPRHQRIAQYWCQISELGGVRLEPDSPWYRFEPRHHPDYDEVTS